MPPFSSERWRLLSPYLDAALEMHADERATWLAAIGVRDASLAADLQALLAEHGALDASRFLDTPLLDHSVRPPRTR
jgi:hypothetical protein